MFNAKFAIVTLATVAISSAALAHGDQIYLYMDGATPTVATKLESDGSLVAGRAFAGELVWNAGQNAYSTNVPGWAWDTSLAPTDSLHFDFLYGLQKWNGTDFEAAGTTATVKLSFDSVTTGAGFVSGLTTLVGANDHWHYRYNINGFAENDPAAVGVYRLAFLATRLGSTNTQFPGFSVVLNLGDTEDNHMDALAFAYANPVPEPSSFIALGLGALVLRKKIRR